MKSMESMQGLEELYNVMAELGAIDQALSCAANLINIGKEVYGSENNESILRAYTFVS